MCGPSPSLALPRRTLLPRHSNTDAHDCVHNVQAGPPVLESRRAVSGGDTAKRAASAGGDALSRSPCPPDTHQRKHTAAGGRMGALPCYAPSTHAHDPDVKAFTYPSMHSGALLPRHGNTDAHDCVHTSPCIAWRADTWHAGTRAHTYADASGTPAAPTSSVAATLAPCCSSVCTTAACPRAEAECKLVRP